MKIWAGGESSDRVPTCVADLCVSALTHVCWPNSCSNFRDACPPLFIGAAVGIYDLCVLVSLAQNPAVWQRYFTGTCQNREPKHRACRAPASCGARWGKQLAKAVSSAATAAFACWKGPTLEDAQCI